MIMVSTRKRAQYDIVLDDKEIRLNPQKAEAEHA